MIGIALMILATLIAAIGLTVTPTDDRLKATASDRAVVTTADTPVQHNEATL